MLSCLYLVLFVTYFVGIIHFHCKIHQLNNTVLFSIHKINIKMVAERIFFEPATRKRYVIEQFFALNNNSRIMC